MSPDDEQGRQARWRQFVERWASPAEQWRTNVQRWVDAGIVSQSQGDEILSAQRGAQTDIEVGGLSRGQELTSYALLVVLAMSTALFLGHFWSNMGRAGHLSVALLISVDASVVGASICELTGAGARRLGGLLFLVATVAVATSVADALGTGPTRHGLRLFIVGLTVLATSVALWRNRDRPLQFLSAVTGLLLTLCGLSALARVQVTSTQLALFLWLCAFALVVASLQLIRPAVTALILGAVGCFVAALSLSFPHPLGGVLLGLASTAAAVVLGVLLVRPFVLVLGGLGFFMFDIRAFSLYLRSTNAAIGAGVLGLLIVLVAIWHAAHTIARERSAVESLARADVESEVLTSS